VFSISQAFVQMIMSVLIVFFSILFEQSDFARI